MNIIPIAEELERKADVLKQVSASTVASLVAGFYLLFTVVALGLHGWDPLWFVWLGERYADLDPAGRTGYDGQFVYYLASDGSAGIPHLDSPAYRLQRILLPVTVRYLSMGSPVPVPWILLFMNFSAIVVTAYLLAKWLKDQNLSPWYALPADRQAHPPRVLGLLGPTHLCVVGARVEMSPLVI